jgi:hypothetical protein
MVRIFAVKACRRRAGGRYDLRAGFAFFRDDRFRSSIRIGVRGLFSPLWFRRLRVSMRNSMIYIRGNGLKIVNDSASGSRYLGTAARAEAVFQSAVLREVCFAFGAA